MQGMINAVFLTGMPARSRYFFQIVHRVSAVVEDGGGQRGVGFAFGEDAHESAPASPRRREAMTGMCVARETARVSAQSKPVCTPSVSMEVSRISPAPELFAARRPFDGVDAFVVAAAARVDVPVAGAMAPRVDGQDHGLRAEFAG